MKKIKSLLFLLSFCACFAFSTQHKKEQTSQVYAGIGIYNSYNGGTPKDGAIISLVGVAQSTAWGAIWGAAYGGPAGIVAGAVAGL